MFEKGVDFARQKIGIKSAKLKTHRRKGGGGREPIIIALYFLCVGTKLITCADLIGNLKRRKKCVGLIVKVIFMMSCHKVKADGKGITLNSTNSDEIAHLL